jgi:hypothetical protein
MILDGHQDSSEAEDWSSPETENSLETESSPETENDLAGEKDPETENSLEIGNHIHGSQ